MVGLIASDLRRRAAAGIRFWRGLQSIAEAPAPARLGATDTATDIALLIDDEMPWLPRRRPTFFTPLIASLDHQKGFLSEEGERALIVRIDDVNLSPFRFQQWTGNG